MMSVVDAAPPALPALFRVRRLQHSVSLQRTSGARRVYRVTPRQAPVAPEF